MDRGKIFIRVDGNNEIGLGHIYRGIAVAQMLVERYSPLFLLKEDSTVQPVSEAGFDYMVIPATVDTANEVKWLQENLPGGAKILIDGYQFDSLYQREIKKAGFKTVYIDDLKKYHIHTDWVINHSPEAREEDYVAEPYTGFALGTEYALLRREFLLAAREQNRFRPLDTAFVCFGGSDYYDLTYKVAEVLVNHPEVKQINVVLGAAYKHDRIFELMRRNKSKVNIYRNLSPASMVSLMDESGFAVVPASTVMYEVAAVGLPVLCGYYAGNQKNIYSAFTGRGAAIGIGKWQEAETDDIVKAIEKLNSDTARKMIAQQRKLIDGKSDMRIRRIFDFMDLSLREVNEEDVDLLFEWVNDPDVRRNAVNPKKIEYQEHKNWFARVLDSQKTLIFILEKGTYPVGQVRFAWSEEDSAYVIDYSIDKKERGKGYGKEIIRLGMIELHKRVGAYTLLAVVRRANIASLKVFEGLKFDVLSQDSEFVTFIYKKSKLK